MALAQFPPTPDRAERMPIESSPPPSDEGFFVPEWLRFDTKVADVQPYKEVEQFDGGEFTFDAYTMSDDTVYHMMEGHPDDQLSEIPVDSTTAWWTRLQGHNALTDKGLVRAGFRTRRMSAELIPHPDGVTPTSLLAAVAKGWNVSLGYSAHNYLEILEAADQSIGANVQPGISLWTGESRNPMLEPGFNLLGRTRPVKRLVAHADSVDPCAPEQGLRRNPVRLGQLVLAEGEAVWRNGWTILNSADREEYKGSVAFTLENFIPNITNAHCLLSNEAADLARLRPKDLPMHLQLMKRSYGNGQGQFEEIYADHPLVYIQPRGGAHMDIPRARRGVLRRHGLMITQLQQNGDDPLALDFEKVYELPHHRGPSRGLLRLVVSNHR